MASPAMLNVAPVPLVRLIAWTALVVAMGWVAKERLVGERLTPAGGLLVPEEPEGDVVPVPKRLILCVPQWHCQLC
jgi:hypothetical protein